MELTELLRNNQRLTVPVTHNFIADLKDSVRDAKGKPAGEGNMVAVYGTCGLSFLTLILFDRFEKGSGQRETMIISRFLFRFSNASPSCFASPSLPAHTYDKH